jgi:hypothetical protein
VQAALDAKERLTREQVASVHRILLEHARGPRSMGLATSAVAAIYTEGDASLPIAAYQRTVARLDEDLVRILSLERIQALFDAVHHAATHPGAEVGSEHDVEELLRAAVRDTIESSLAAEGVEPEVRNAVRERLEHNFTTHDQADDLQDERFVVRVTLPGAVVAGNHDRLEGRTAIWEFDGEGLYGRDRTLRAVSVLE